MMGSGLSYGTTLGADIGIAANLLYLLQIFHTTNRMLIHS